MIRCYNCGNELNKSGNCPICNANVSAYKKVVAKSYRLYNEALEAAMLRDISRAVPLLKNALKAYKANTEARNLLGLCYYEVGDVMMALKEWVISKSLQQTDNKAAEYISRVQSNRQRLDNMNSMIRKYNLALRDCEQDKLDVAVIQLKKVTGSSIIRILPAFQLLGLIYIKLEEYKKAYDILSQAEKIDRYNNTTLTYLKELELLMGDARKRKKRSQRKRPADGTDGTDAAAAGKAASDGEYFSYVSYKEPSPIVAFGSLIFGLVLGGLLVWLLVLPAKEQSISAKYNQEISEMSEKASVLQNSITNLQDEVALYKQAADDIKSESSNRANKTRMSKSLLSAYAEMKNGNNQKSQEMLKKVDVAQISDNEVLLYYEISMTVYESEIKTLYNEGYSELRRKNYNNAISKFKEILKLHPDHDDSMYYLAAAYAAKDEKQSAIDVLQEYLQVLPDGKHSRAVSRELLKLQSELAAEVDSEE